MDLIGTTIGGKYRLEKQLGEGGMGMVFAATQIGLNRKCAVKLLHESLSRDGHLVARFKREAEVAASIGHPNIVQVTDFGFEDGKVFLVMDLLRGMPLADAIERDAPLPAERMRFIATQVLSALDAAHQRDIVHRDLKPDNIYLTSLSGVADVVKLLDFGIARMTGEQSQKMTTTGQVLGTPAYMSPEQARGKKVDARTDLYSLGVVMYEALSGRMPVDGDNYHELMFNIVGEEPIPLVEYRPDLPKALLDIVSKSMAKDPEQRYQTANEMRRELEALGPIEASSPPAVDIPHTRVSDPDAFAKTVTPEAVQAISTDPSAQSVEAVPTRAAVTMQTQPKSSAAVAGLVMVLIAGIAGGVYAVTRSTDPGEMVAVNAPPTETAEDGLSDEQVRELAKQMFEELEHQREAETQMESETEAEAEAGEADNDDGEASETSMSSSVSSMSSMASMSASDESGSPTMMGGGGTPAHARFTLVPLPPPNDWARANCCPDGWHDGRGIPVVWASCNGSNKEVYPVLPRTRLSFRPSQGNNVVALDQLRPFGERHAAAVTECYRGHVVVRGQNIRLDIDATGRIDAVRPREYCPIAPQVTQCLRRLLEGETLPPDRDAPGEVVMSIGVVGA